ncbi:hypothetical protein LMHOCYYV_CDS0023 [Staphylococcus phage PG-2021_4]
MEFKAGDRVHVTIFHNEKVNFYATLGEMGSTVVCLIDCTNKNFNYRVMCLPNNEHFGKDKEDYYTLVTEEDKTNEQEWRINNCLK